MIKAITLLLSLSIILSGCGLSITQREAATRFANASSGLGQFTAKELTSLREATIQMNSKDIALGGKAKINDLDGAFDSDAIKARVNAAVTLSAYGNLLMALVDDNQASHLKSAAMQFSDSIKGVSGNSLSDNQLDTLGGIVYSISGYFLEWQKANALKDIVISSKADIDRLCDLLIDDFDPTKLKLAQAIDNTSKGLKADAAIALDTKSDINERLFIIDAYNLADQQKQRIKKVGIQASEALKALKAANAELANALANDSDSLVDAKLLGIKMKELCLALKITNSI
jgi:hypothetical protein